MQSNHTVPTILVAIELSTATWLVAVRVPGSEKPHLHRVDGGDTAALLALIASVRARAAHQLNAEIGIVCCFEAGRDGFWLHRLLTTRGITNYVLEPTMFLNRPAFSSTAAPDGPKRIGSMQKACCVCLPPISEVITKSAAWSVCRHRTRRMPSACTGRART